MTKPWTINLSRRAFISATATAAGGLVVTLYGCGGKTAKAEAAAINAFVRIEPDGVIHIGAPKPDMGQGMHTSLPMIIAEELDADWAKVEVEAMAAVAIEETEDGFAPAIPVAQFVGGSTSIWTSYDDLRSIGAEARRRLAAAAAARWDVPVEQCRTDRGRVIGPSGQSVDYAEIAAEAAQVPVPDEPPALKNRNDFHIIGSAQPSVHVRKIVTGAMEYGIDAELPGMLHAVIARAPSLNGKLVSFDAGQALNVDGVRHVVRIDGPERMGDFNYNPVADGVAVIADSLWAAMKGRDALAVEWKEGPMQGVGLDDVRGRIDKQLETPGQVIRHDGDPDAAFAQSDRIIEAAYESPLVSHATLEPQGCIAWVKPDEVELIAPTQDPYDAVHIAMARTGLPASKIKAAVTRIGGGFGRRLETDYVAEAVLASQAAKAPVRVHWTREDDMRNDFYRPLAAHRLRCAVGPGGELAAWSHKLATTGRYFRRGVSAEELYRPEYWTDDFPAQIIPNMDVQYHFVETAVPTGAWRAPGHTANAFAVECFLDEIAESLGEDPIDLRLRLYGEARDFSYEQHGGPIFNTGRLAGVLKRVRDESNWGEPLPPGRGRGVAAHFTFGSYAANVIEVEMTADGKLAILRVDSAIDCGLAVNPNGVRAQVESGVHDGLSTALYQEITFSDGRIDQANFDAYRMMRLAGAPLEVNVYIMDADYPPTGVGEPPLPPVAPALCNAIYAASGRRIRRLPVARHLSI